MKWMTLERAFLMLTMSTLLACQPDDSKPNDSPTDDMAGDMADDGTIDGTTDDDTPDDGEPDGDDVDGDDVIDGDDPVDGPTDEDEDGDDGEPIGVDHMLPTGLSADFERLLRSACELEIACGFTRPGETADTCLVQYAQFFCGPGYATVELPGLDDCLATFTCESAEDPPDPACHPLNDAITRAEGHTVGQLGEGCNVNGQAGSQQCAYGTYCDGNAEQCGRCAAPKANGETCEADDECTSNFCDFDDGKCHDLRADGVACAWDFECASGACVDEECGPVPSVRACESDFECDFFTERCVNDVCTPNKVPGAACTSHDECDVGCSNQKCLWPITCSSRELGESCGSVAQCKAPLGCDGSQCITRVAIGEACTADSFAEAMCAAGAYCADADAFDDTPGQCAALKADGSDCDDDLECTSGYCDDVGKCAVPELCMTAMQRRHENTARPVRSASWSKPRGLRQLLERR
jgi:hypothetical protein